MRISVSGSHMVGKTTLAEMLADALPHYELVPEPYYLLEDEGFLFAEMPSVEDFEQQLERSFQSIHESGADAIFDRCPLDIIGYLVTHQDADMFQIEDWMPGIQESVVELDLIVFVPVEMPDLIIQSYADAALRNEVDEVLRDIIVDDTYGFGTNVLTVSGTPEERMRQVLAHVR